MVVGKEGRVVDDLDPATDSPEGIIKKKIDDRWGAVLPQLILAKTDADFDSLLRSFLADRAALGYDRLMVRCGDGHERVCRIRGKMKRRVWIKVGDTVLVAPWDFQADSRGDILWRYTESQANWLRSQGRLAA